jgi:hypothetical protein
MPECSRTSLPLVFQHMGGARPDDHDVCEDMLWRIEHIEHIVIALLYNKLAGVCLFSFVNAPWTGIMFFRQVE